MKKIALKLAGAAIAVPILLGGLALPANAAATPPSGTAAIVGSTEATATHLPVKSPGASDGTVVTAAAAAAGGGFGSPVALTKALKAKTVATFASVRKANAWLGSSTGPIKYNQLAGTATQKFKGGSIVGSVGWNAYALRPAIHKAFLSYGTAKYQYLGYPTSAEITLKGVGSVQHFVAGDIHWSPKGGAHHVVLRDIWNQHGGMTGRLGYPTSGWIMDGTKGYHQNFKGGKIVLTKTAGPNNIKVVFYKK